MRLAGVLADLVVLALVQDRSQRRAEHLVEHTVGTLNDRVHLSQAAGMVVAATDLEPHQARRGLRAYARRLRRPLPEVVRAITDHQLDPSDVVEAIRAVTPTDSDGQH